MNKKLAIVLIGAFAFGTYAIAVRGDQSTDSLRFTSITLSSGQEDPQVFEIGDVEIVTANGIKTETVTYDDRVTVTTTKSDGGSEVVTRDLDGKVLRRVTSKDFAKFLGTDDAQPMRDMMGLIWSASKDAKEVGKGKFRGQPCKITQMEYEHSGTKSRMVMWQPEDERLADKIGTLKTYMYEVGDNGELKLEFGRVALLK